MIQRIQTVYLFLAGIVPAITFFVPLIIFTDGTRWANMTAIGYDSLQVQELAGNHPYGVMFFTALSITIALIAVFGYKNRKAQIRKAYFALLSNVLWYVTLGTYAYSISERANLSLTPAICSLLPVLSILLIVMAIKAIHKDEELVRSADRIR